MGDWSRYHKAIERNFAVLSRVPRTGGSSGPSTFFEIAKRASWSTYSLRVTSRLYASRRTESSRATGPQKRGDNQTHRARVLEVRIHLPPAGSQRTFSSSTATVVQA